MSRNRPSGSVLVQKLCRLVWISGFCCSLQAGEGITIAAAADLKFALDEVVSEFRKSCGSEEIAVAYGSSGKALAQIRQGAPFDLFFSADIAYPQQLVTSGLAVPPVTSYAIGRIVIWSNTLDASRMLMKDLVDPRIQHIATANPEHAPYGQRAIEALKASGLWEKVESRMVYGENIAQAAQFVQSGNAEVGLIALSVALSPTMMKSGRYWVIPEVLHQPLDQGYVVLKRGANKPLVRKFARFMASPQVRAIMIRYGFMLPGEKAK